MTIDDDLLRRLRAHEVRVAEATRLMRAVDHEPDDAFRGLYITDEHVDRLLGHGVVTVEPTDLVGPPQGTALGHLAETFALDAIDIEILVVALAPDIDRRFEQLYGYLHDDVTRRRASPGLTLSLLGLSPLDAAMRQRFVADAPLVANRLLEIEDGERPFLTRGLRVPDRVTSAVLGADAVDPDLTEVLVEVDPLRGTMTDGLGRGLLSGARVYLRERVDRGAAGLGAGAFAGVGLEPLAIDLTRVDPPVRFGLAELAVREAQLSRRGLVVGPVDGVDDATIRVLADARTPVVLHGADVWNPAWTRQPVVVIDAPEPSGAERLALWEEQLVDVPDAVTAIASAFRLGPSQIRRAVASGRAHAEVFGPELDEAALAAGARAQNSAGLERLARRLSPDAGWDHLVLPRDTETQLRHLVSRVAQRAQVLDRWGMRRGGGRGEGITALFAGDSGTGKTLAAEVIASMLGLDLYVIDLSTVVDKYVGETEKNLERIFTEAEGVNGVLFFDEADALFGKRSEVSDARDRYANVEVAYLLQRMEQFDGLAILASNLRANLDEAFSRRLSVVVDFPDPDKALRRRLWSAMIGDVPTADDVDIGFLADGFELTGGNIRNVAVTAAYLAADQGTAVDMEALIRGVQIEYRKLGRLCLPNEFGPFIGLVDGSRNGAAPEAAVLATTTSAGS